MYDLMEFEANLWLFSIDFSEKSSDICNKVSDELSILFKQAELMDSFKLESEERIADFLYENILRLASKLKNN
jgi:hypothetical protein